MLQLAIKYATDQHKHQVRKNSTSDPYIVHPLNVMAILIDCGVTNNDVLCAAVLHDTIEDTDTTYKNLSELFGNNIAEIVAECTDNKSLNKVLRKKAQIEHSTHMSDGAKLVKLADKYSNISTLYFDPPLKWSKEEIDGYAKWGFCVCQGLYGVNSTLDNLMQNFFKNIGIENVSDEDLSNYYSYISNKI